MCSLGEVLGECAAAASSCLDNATLTDNVYRQMIDEVSEMVHQMAYHPWIMSALGSLLVGLSGVFPLLIIPIEDGASIKQEDGARFLRILLSFAVGGLLGDVFLHLLPEAWASRQRLGTDPSIAVGSWVLAGLLLFIVAEKVFSFNDLKESLDDPTSEPNLKSSSSKVENNNNTLYRKEVSTNNEKRNSVAGYLNLLANSIDNFTHGLAVGGSFLISFRMGAFSTIAILIHEIPHEVGDFAILLRAGFTRWEAAQAQLCTAFAGLVGSMVAVIFSEASGSVEARTSWILPFTAGGFLHISLVTVLPELLQEKNPWESLKQMSSLLAGIGIMAVLTILVD